MRYAVLLLGCATLALSSADAATLRVWSAAAGSVHDGASWPTAFAKVKEALAAAKSGDEVWVAAGTYNETVTLPSGVGLYGGFTGTETLREQRAPKVNVTTLDGTGKSGSVVFIPAAATPTTVLDGFTLRNGGGTLVVRNVVCGHWGCQTEYEYRGGGVYVDGGAPVISNNVITGNATTQAPVQTGPSNAVVITYGGPGGGIYVNAGTPTIQGNTVSGNASRNDGGGIYIRDGGCRLLYNRISGNTGLQGGGLVVGEAVPSTGHAFVLGNTIIGNESLAASQGNYYVGGGGVYIGAASPTLASNVIARNISRGEGGGIFSGYANPHLLNNTVVDNTAAGTGGGLYLSNQNNPAFPVTNNIVAFNSSGIHVKAGTLATYSHNDLYGNAGPAFEAEDPAGGPDPTGTNGNISADPLFGYRPAGDYHLQPGSPCIDAGDDAVLPAVGTDADGNPRRIGAHVDIGAYEAGASTPAMWGDVAGALRVAGGLRSGGTGGTDLASAVRLARRVAGIEP